jgi:hypothetical protein
MGMFAETAIVDYRLYFADQEIRLPFSFAAKKRKLAVFDFRLQQINGSW